MALSQSLLQKQLQKLSPQQIQLMKLLQIPTANIEQRVKDEIEENPALEYAEDTDISNDSKEDMGEDFDNSIENEEDFELTGSQEEYDNIDISEYIHEEDDEVADYRTYDDGYGEVHERKDMALSVENSMYDTLTSQLGMLSLDEHQYKIAEQIIGSIDNDGYLRREATSIVDDLAFRQNISTNEQEVNTLISAIQQFEPAGICARNLRECLLLQLDRIEHPQDSTLQNAKKVLTDYFEEFTKKHYEKIAKSLDVSEETLKEIIHLIIHLNPKPGGVLESINKAENYIVPDFFINNNNGALELSLNAKNAPDLRISQEYKEMLKDYNLGSKKDKQQKDAVIFIKQKIDSAKWFIDMIKQRQHTLLSTMNAIMDYQSEFFLTGDETAMRPMILKDVSERTGLDVSTISRVANSKFVQTEFGTYRLKFFFSESISTNDGEEVSTREVKKILTDVIDAEDKQKPYSDEALTDILQQKGYNIARRTVAKYREQLNLPVARLRKTL